MLEAPTGTAFAREERVCLFMGEAPCLGWWEEGVHATHLACIMGTCFLNSGVEDLYIFFKLKCGGARWWTAEEKH